MHEGCASPHKICVCINAPRVWTCSRCTYEMKQHEEPTRCDVCYYVDNRFGKHDIEGDMIKVRFTKKEDVHSGYCSDYEDMEDEEGIFYAYLPARVDKKQLASLRWSMDNPHHCCCGSQISWSNIQVEDD